MHSIPPSLGALAATVLLAASPAVQAQAHLAKSGPCSLRSSTVESRSIAALAADRQGISRAADLAIVNVTVTCRGGHGNGTVPADVDVTRADAVGTVEHVDMHEDRQNGYVSYYGTYPHTPGQTVRIAVSATPLHMQRQMAIEYRHRFAIRP